MSIDLERAEQLLSHLCEIVGHPLWDHSTRFSLAATLAFTSLEFGAATRLLCVNDLALGAAATLRSQFEAIVRSAWALHCASDSQVERLSAELRVESQQAAKNMPSVQEVIAAMEKQPPLANLLVAIREFKESAWTPLNSFVHSGIHAIHWTRNDTPPVLLETLFRTSNGLAILAFQSLAILTGRPHLQSEIFAATASYSSCLPARR